MQKKDKHLTSKSWNFVQFTGEKNC